MLLLFVAIASVLLMRYAPQMMNYFLGMNARR